MIEITAGDFLAGGGGVTEAMTKISGLKVKWVLNHSQVAIRTNMHNHKGVKHYLADFYKQDEHEMDKVDFVWASIECTQHSRANGGREKKIGSYTLGWELLRYVKHIQPLVIGIENVPEFKKWAPLGADGQPDKKSKGEEFRRWKEAICMMGYEYSELICNAADYGIPTRRVRFFAFFTKKYLGISIDWPKPTHSKDGKHGLKKWVACKSFIDLQNEGHSIFGRELNPEINKGKRRPLSENTLKRIAGGIKKYAPELAFIFQYYGNGSNIQSLNSPLNTVTTIDRHALVTLENLQFITDHIQTDNFHLPEEPMRPILTRQTKQLITAQFLNDYYGRNDTAHSIEGPANTITTENSKNLISCHFISNQYNSNGNPGVNNQSVEDPLNSITRCQKQQFISAYYNSSNKPESQNQSLEDPLNAITTGTNKQALISAIESGGFDFDIKMRFLDPEELSLISTFPEKYFSDPLLRLSKKEQTKLIGNAVPPEWARILIEPVIRSLQEVLEKREVV